MKVVDANGRPVKVGDKVRFVGRVERVTGEGMTGTTVRASRNPHAHVGPVVLLMPPHVLEVMEDDS